MLCDFIIFCVFLSIIGALAGAVWFLRAACIYGQGVDPLDAIHDLMMWTPRG